MAGLRQFKYLSVMKLHVVISLFTLAGCVSTPHPSLAGARYVAMGSSYAAGPGTGPIDPDSPKRCGRSISNYPHLVAQRLQLNLVDVSCSGATTMNVLRPWADMPAQIEAVTPDTRLVTVTIGGNDVSYVGNLITSMCRKATDTSAPGNCRRTTPAPESAWVSLEQHMGDIAREVAKRAPQARLVFIDYLQIIPDRSTCATIPLQAEQIVQSRETYRRLAKLTARVAREQKAILIPIGRLSKAHTACSASPWAVAYSTKTAMWHPTAAGHVAIAEALAKHFGRN